MEKTPEMENFCRIYKKEYGTEQELEHSFVMLERACAMAGKNFDLYLLHNIAVAGILITLHMDKKIILAGLNHNLITLGLTEKEIEQEFGGEILSLIDEKVRLERALSFKKESLETLRKKLMIVMSANPDIFILQLAEALDKVRNLNALTEAEQKEFLAEAREVYAPLAIKLGIYSIGSEINEIVFRHENPAKYGEISSKIKTITEKLSERIDQTKQSLEFELRKNQIPAQVYGRIKTAYSTNEKMKRKNCPIEKIYDIIALRIITSGDRECYEALGIIHSLWKPVPGEFDDYIARPKENGYRSLHTTVFLDENIPIEIQVRTSGMQDFAEYGLASHWRYKGEKKDTKYDRKIEWVKQVLDWQNTAGTNTEMDIFGREIFAMTPKGEIVELPEGACTIDFAYAVHSDLGNRCQGAKINGKPVPLDTQIKNGDVIEITVSEKQKPKIGWLNFTKTQKARQKIRSALGLDKKEEKKKTLATNLNAIKTTDQRARLAKCCTPLPGDEIVGVKTTKRKISVHRSNCNELEKIQGQKIPVKWESGSDYYETQITAITKEKIGILKEILEVFSKTKIQILSTTVKKGNQNMNFCVFRLKAKNLEQLDSIVKRLSEINGVIELRR